MKRPSSPEAPAALNIRNIPRETFYRLKMAAAAEHKTVRDLVVELIEGKIQELEKKGVLPKAKG
jgi:plasmid stability protein